MLGAEIIRFISPGEGTTVFLNNFPLRTTEDDLFHAVRRFGPIYKLSIIEKEIDSDGTPILQRYAFVKYYSMRHANDCMKHSKTIKLHGSKLLSKMATARKTDKNVQNATTEYDLPFDKSVELINNFLGYNCWSSKIVELEGVEFSQLEDGFYSSRFRTTVRLTFKGDERCVEAEGEGEALEDDRCTAVDNSRKRAVTEARKNAFKKLSIILLDNDKTFLYIKDQPLPLFLFENEEETEQRVKKEKEEGEKKVIEEKNNIIGVASDSESEVEEPKFKKPKITYTVSHSY
jgi:RNA recognition motif-containing protein